MNAIEVSPLDYHSQLKVNRGNIFAKDSYLSKSVLWELDSCSLYRWRYAPKTFEGSAAADWGTLLDCLVTAPEEIDQITARHSFPSFRTKEAREFRDAAKAAGKILVDVDYQVELTKAAMKIKANRLAAEIIEKSKTQVLLSGKFKEVQFKGLVDLAPEGEPYLADIKTTGDFSLEGFSKKVGSLGYHVQAALYLKMWNQMFPDDQRNRFRHIWQSQAAPYEVAVTELGTMDINDGEEYCSFLLRKLIKAAKTNQWPNICDDKVAMISLPAFAKFSQEEKMDGIYEAPKVGKGES